MYEEGEPSPDRRSNDKPECHHRQSDVGREINADIGERDSCQRKHGSILSKRNIHHNREPSRPLQLFFNPSSHRGAQKQIMPHSKAKQKPSHMYHAMNAHGVSQSITDSA